MQLVEQHQIKINHKFYKEIDGLSFKSKNLYNQANYIIRQSFIKENKYLNYNFLSKKLQKEDSYTSLPSKVSQQILKVLDKNWISFFKSIKEWSKNKDKYKGKPNLPKYKNKTKGRNVLIYTNQCLSKRTYKKEKLIHLSGTNIKINSKVSLSTIKQVRIIPRINMYLIEIIYEKEENTNGDLDKNKFISIDLGVNNLATITSNKEGFIPLIINGRVLKSINQYYNKKKAKLQSYVGTKGTSNKIRKLTLKRNNKIKDYLHKTTKYLIDVCLKENIGTIVVGKNIYWKNELKMKHDNDRQNFVNIPYNDFISMLEYKCKLNGLNFILNEESYTSKSSFIDNDEIPTYKKGKVNLYKFSGSRTKRGQYKTKEGFKINADVNGSLNIARKVFPEFNINNIEKGIKAVVVSPIKINIYLLDRDFYKHRLRVS